MAKQTADNPSFIFSKTIRRDEIEHDVVIVASVKGDVIASRLDDGADNVNGLIAIEWRNLDGDDVCDFGKAPPKGEGQGASTDGGLKIKSNDGDSFCNSATMSD